MRYYITPWRGGDLTGLWSQLNERARVSPDYWHGASLRSGARVSLKVRRETWARTLRITRLEKPTTARGPALWAKEVDVFARAFGVMGWAREEDPNALGVGVRFMEQTCSECERALDVVSAALYGDTDVCTCRKRSSAEQSDAAEVPHA